jgi:hypothetical protein
MSPAGQDKAQCFAVRRGEIKDRIDPKFVLYGGHQTLKDLPIAALGSLVVSEPEYGSAKRSVPLKSPDDVKYIRITDFGDDGIAPGHEFVTAEEIEDKYRLEEDNVLFARSGATAGKTFIYTKDIGSAIFAGYCIRFRFNPKKVLPWYVYFYTKTSRYLSWVKSMQRPAGQPNINKEEFKSFTIPVVAPTLQDKLVKGLQAARQDRDAKLADADALLNGIDDLVLAELGLPKPMADERLAFAVSLSEIVGNPINAERYKGLRIQRLLKGVLISTIADVLKDKVTPSKEAPNTEWDWIRIDDLPNMPIAVDNIRTELGANIGGSFFEVRTGDILLARLGPTLLNRKIVLCPSTKRRTVASGEFLVLRCKPGWSPEAVLWVLRTTVYRDLMYSKCRGATPSRYRLNAEDLSNLPFPNVEEPTQEKIVAYVQTAITKAKALRAEAAALWAKVLEDFENNLLAQGANL